MSDVSFFTQQSPEAFLVLPSRHGHLETLESSLPKLSSEWEHHLTWFTCPPYALPIGIWGAPIPL